MRRIDEGRRDEGSALILVLVLTIVASLVVVPLMTYAVAVLRSNQVLSERTSRIEAVKAGFRLAMAEPQELYETCGTAGLNVSRPLPSPGLDIHTETECYLLDVASAQDANELPWGLATTFVDEVPPSGDGIVGLAYPGSGDTDPEAWLDEATELSEFQKVWLPNLPVHGLNLRSPIGFEMPTGYSLNGYSQCTVYFPGTYRQEIVIDGPTYFTSGIYYFEDEIRFTGGADAVGGSGSELGCVDDQYAAFYATGAPATHNISGLGVTFVLGDEGRIKIDDVDGDVSLAMNQRYVSDEDTGGSPSARVSVMTVNGDLDEVLEATDFENSGTSLAITDQLVVPLSLVGSVTPRDAPEDEYRPSVWTPEPRVSDAPEGVEAVAYDEAAVVSWDAPDSGGGSLVTQYTVTGTPGNHQCVAVEQLSCAVTGLTNGETYKFSVVATNGVGDSDTSDESDELRPSGSDDSLARPGRVRSLSIEEDPVAPVPGTSRYSNTLLVSWDPPIDDGGAPIAAYDVVVNDGSSSWSCSTTGALSCAVEGLPDAALASPPYDMDVTATNVIGVSDPEPLFGLMLPIAPAGETYVPPEPPQPPPFEPDPVLEIDGTESHHVSVMIPGYIAVPQGVVRVAAVESDPTAATIELQGGVLAAWIELVDPRPNEFVFGQLNPTTQRLIRVVTRTTDGSRAASDAVVQINENEGWAVNSWEVQSG